MKYDIGVIQFPGSNTERETILALQRVGLNPVEFLWNENINKLRELDGFIIVGGFSYEDRSRAGLIASLDPVIKNLKLEAAENKPILGICNGAQILVESGLVPEILSGEVAIALTENKRIKNKSVIGTGYYNNWCNLKLAVKPNRSAFTNTMNYNQLIRIPFAHAEGRFLVPKELLMLLIKNNQLVFQYCNEEGSIINDFPVNPNGSDNNISAICNASGNVMAIMPHPERTGDGDTIFRSMKYFIKNNHKINYHPVNYKRKKLKINSYKISKKYTNWFIDMIITDNEAISIESSIKSLGIDVNIKKQIHWEIESINKKKVLKEIMFSGELFNPNKEKISSISRKSNKIILLIRPKEDIFAKSKLESLKNKFNIENIIDLKRSVVWNITFNSLNIESDYNQIINKNIFFNPLSHKCYEIS